MSPSDVIEYRSKSASTQASVAAASTKERKARSAKARPPRPTKRSEASLGGERVTVISTGRVAQRPTASRVPHPSAADTLGAATEAADRAAAASGAAATEAGAAATASSATTGTPTATRKPTRREAGKAARVAAAERETRAQAQADADAATQSQDGSREKAGTSPRRPHIRISLPRPRPLSPEARKRLLVGVVAVLLAFAVVYEPLRALYSARRDEQILTAKLEHVNAANEYLQDSVDSIQTREGIENEARRRGYVEQGETAVSVEGLDTSDDELDVLTDDNSSTGETPWYLRACDFLFQYTPSA